MQYLIVLHTDDGSSYGVTVPDLPGCFSGAETFEEALLLAKEAIAFHIEGILLDGSLFRISNPIKYTRPMRISPMVSGRLSMWTCRNSPLRRRELTSLCRPIS